MTVPGRLTLDDRPAGAKRRSRFGHYEMDTVVSSTNGTDGLLVLVDRKSRRYVIEKLEHVTQADVVAALKRMLARKVLGRVRSVKTDNGCEFLDPKKIKAVVGCDVYYTRAYASWKKGAVENCNRFVRRWYPKGILHPHCKTSIAPLSADRELDTSSWCGNILCLDLRSQYGGNCPSSTCFRAPARRGTERSMRRRRGSRATA